jgi:hypothetical protein
MMAIVLGERRFRIAAGGTLLAMAIALTLVLIVRR